MTTPHVAYDVSQPHYSTYSGQPSPDGLSFYQSQYGNMDNSKNMDYVSAPSKNAFGMYDANAPWWTAFGTGGRADEPPLFEEIGINVSHIRAKTLAVLNPLGSIDRQIMEDADLAGPLLFCLLFGAALLLVGKVQFGYIYGIGMLGCLSLYVILNLMSEPGIDTWRTASILGYCLLPMVLLSTLAVLLKLRGPLGYVLGIASVLWCTVAASSMFVTALSMKDQRFLVAYPVALLYTCFALMTIF